jgi:hypothetical protein
MTKPETKEVYVWGHAYYDAYSGVEVQVFFDHEIVFEVPADMNNEEPTDELNKQVLANATERIRERLGSKIIFKERCWDLDYVVHNVNE